ncbi:MAG: MBOAT family O-acyltransferase [Lachnospiraceae bacterium]
MIFSSYEFLLVFLPITLIVYWTLNHFRYHDLAKIWLVLVSFYFYAQGSTDFFPFFLGSVMANYAIGTTLCRMQEEHQKRQRQLLMSVGVIANIALLGYYKYMNFFLENINYVFGTEFVVRKLALPIGISFFTFQLIAFLVDSYRGQTKQYNVLDYLLFITFFPQLIVGPIVHHAEMTPQFADENNMRIIPENVALGIFIFTIGCAKKMILADPLNGDAASFYQAIGQTPVIWESWFYTLEYSIAYYFDLSGYTDMAIGLGLLFNIHLPENFNAPWKARNMQEYWQRQHMTLSRFLGGYVFKNVFRKGNRWRNYYIATMATFLVSGIWHGAGWNFIIWGLMNGVLVCIGAWQNYHKKHPPYLVGVILTFICVNLTRVIFVAKDLKDTWTVYKSMFNVKFVAQIGWSESWQAFTEFITVHQQESLLLIISLLICWFAPTTRQMADKFRTNLKYLIFTGGLLSYCILNMNKVVQFLYFQF